MRFHFYFWGGEGAFQHWPRLSHSSSEAASIAATQFANTL